MVKKVIKFEDLNGNQHEQTLLFNLTKVELAKIEKEIPGGMSNKIKKGIEDGDVVEAIVIVDDIITRAYGEKSEDGMSFIKNAAITEKFKNSVAYQTLIDQLLESEEEMNAFLNGLVNA